VKKNLAVTTLIIPFMLILLAGCLGKTPKNSMVAESYADVHTVIVLPVESLKNIDEPTSQKKAQQLAHGAETINRLFFDYFSNMDNIKVISPEQQKVLTGNYKAGRAEHAREIARNLNCDAVLITTVKRYIDRQGNQYSVSQPASAAFDFKLLAAKSGRTICSGSFDETQKSLSENLFSLSGAAKRKFKWITAPDLVTEGIQKHFTTCPPLHQ